MEMHQQIGKHRFVLYASTILEDTLKEKILEAINVAVSEKTLFWLY